MINILHNIISILLTPRFISNISKNLFIKELLPPFDNLNIFVSLYNLGKRSNRKNNYYSFPPYSSDIISNGKMAIKSILNHPSKYSLIISFIVNLI